MNVIPKRNVKAVFRGKTFEASGIGENGRVKAIVLVFLLAILSPFVLGVDANGGLSRANLIGFIRAVRRRTSSFE